MNVSMAGKIALVTGAAQGVGRAVALELARSGVDGICLAVRDREQGENVAEQIRAIGSRATCAVADLADDDAPESVVSHCVSSFGRVDCLVNAAGRTDRASLAGATHDIWDDLFRVNARA